MEEKNKITYGMIMQTLRQKTDLLCEIGARINQQCIRFKNEQSENAINDLEKSLKVMVDLEKQIKYNYFEEDINH